MPAKGFCQNLIEDYEIRQFIKKNYFNASISRITIDRVAKKVILSIYTSRPAILIGKSGAGVEQLKNEVSRICTDKNVIINIREIRKPDADAQLLAESIAASLVKRISFRRAMKQAIGRAIRAGVKGVKVMVSGRLDGAEIEERALQRRFHSSADIKGRHRLRLCRGAHHIRRNWRKMLDI